MGEISTPNAEEKTSQNSDERERTDMIAELKRIIEKKGNYYNNLIRSIELNEHHSYFTLVDAKDNGIDVGNKLEEYEKYNTDLRKSMLNAGIESNEVVEFNEIKGRLNYSQYEGNINEDTRFVISFFEKIENVRSQLESFGYSSNFMGVVDNNV